MWRKQRYGSGTLLNNTTVELGKGDRYTQNRIPFVPVEGGLSFKIRRALDFSNVARNRVLTAATKPKPLQ